MTKTKSVRVAAISDQAIFLRGLTALVLSMPELQFVGQAGSEEEAIQLCQISQPDIVLLDLRIPPESGGRVADQIHRKWPNTRTILLLESLEECQVQEEQATLPLICMCRDISEQELKEVLSHIQHDLIPQLAKARAEEVKPGDLEFEDREPLGLAGELVSQRDEQMITRELTMAGNIQAGILPEEAPSITGWEITARLEPAHETSGDFFDFIPLSHAERKWGVVVADVSDKGIGAALFMALTSTLIRTYARRFPTLPALAMNAVSHRILTDTRGLMFVTTFYGILEPHSGRFIYSNAGHPPAILVSTHRGRESVDRLHPTGMALGVSDETQWKQKIARMNPGDLLVLYTDGITEAESPRGEFFGEKRLVDSILSRLEAPVKEIEETILSDVRRFSGPLPRQDDIALVIIRRLE